MFGQLLINVPTVLNETILTIVNSQQENVLLKLLNNIKLNEKIEDNRMLISFLEEWHKNNRKHAYMHSNGCGCDYCIKTREYANLKLSVHILRNQLDDDYSLYPSERYKTTSEFLSKQETKLKKLIELRKSMRIDLGFISRRVLK